MADVYFRGNRTQFRELMRSVVDALSGRGPDVGGVAHGVFLSVGFAALGDIQQDYIRKSRGGTGEDGVKWPELSPRTIAQRRLGPKDKKLPHIAERLANEKAATKAAIAKFKAEAKENNAARLKSEYKSLLSRFALSLPPEEARARARQIIDLRRKGLDKRTADEAKAANFALRGKFAVTRETGEKRWEVLSRRSVEILRDTNVGFVSLSQGKLDGKGPSASYTRPTSDGGQQQIFEELTDGIIIGTNVPYMKKHQDGDPAKHLPQRSFLPTGPVPRVWAQRWADAGLEALAAGISQLVTT